VITRRDITIALASVGVTLVVTLGATALAGSGLMGSRAVDWNAVQVSQDGTKSVRQFFKAPTATLAELEVHVTTLPAGELSHAPHKHPNEELVIVKEGTVEVLVDGRLQRVGPGSVIFNASNQLHSLRNVGNSAATYHVINWKSH
jgi:XRE family transcriptional regulator, regulator of sulfur utilization